MCTLYETCPQFVLLAQTNTNAKFRGILS